MDQVITVFQHFNKTHEPHYFTVRKALERMRDPLGKAKVRIDALRAATDPDEFARLKGDLPCYCFSGRFMHRADKALTTHSGCAVLDFDHKPTKYFRLDAQHAEGWNEDFPGTSLVAHETKEGLYALHIDNAGMFRDALKAIPFLIAAFISPSGNGVKALAKIPPVIEAHRGHYAALVDYFGVLDSTSRNESRICYEAYDEHLWINEEATEFTAYKVPDEGPASQPTPAATTGSGKINHGKLNYCAAMIRNAADGEKHDVLLKASHLAGGYIAAGILDEATTIDTLESEIAAKGNVRDLEAARKTIREGITFGKKKPIYEQVPEEVPQVKTPDRRAGIVYVADVWDKMSHTFIHGKKRGHTTHYDDLDAHFTWKLSHLILVSGKTQSGKSELIQQLMLAKSINASWKWAIYSPESGEANELFDTFAHAMVGKTTDPYYPERQMTPEEYHAAGTFLNEHIIWVEPETSHTIEEVEACFRYLIENEGVNGVLIDPFNQLSRSFALRDDQYLDVFLSERKRFAKFHDIVYIIAAHPKATLQKNSNGEYDVVDFFDLAGGAMWSNKVDIFISVYRPFQVTKPQDTSVEIHVKKVKDQKLVGQPGVVHWNFDRPANRYYNSLGKTPLPPIAADIRYQLAAQPDDDATTDEAPVLDTKAVDVIAALPTDSVIGAFENARQLPKDPPF